MLHQKKRRTGKRARSGENERASHGLRQVAFKTDNANKQEQAKGDNKEKRAKSINEQNANLCHFTNRTNKTASIKLQGDKLKRITEFMIDTGAVLNLIRFMGLPLKN